MHPQHHPDDRRARPRRWAAAAVVVAALLAGVMTAAPAPAGAQIVLGKDISIPTQGRLGPITVIGDSVLLGGGITSPTLPDQLAARGWGPVTYRSTVGMRAGVADDQNAAGWWINHWRAWGWNAPTVLVNLGANDVGICQANVSCARSRITALLDTIGRGRRVWWPLITHSNGAYAAAWNSALTQIDAERTDVVTWNWPAEMASGGYPSSDGIHLTGAGYVRRSQVIADQVTATVGQGTRVGGGAPVPAASSGKSRFVPIAPTRVIDTRHDAPGRRPDGSELAVSLAGLVPPGATAAAVNVTAASPTDVGFLSAGACGTAYDGSVVNFTPGSPRGAMTVVPLSADGRLCVRTRGATDVIVDLQGAFTTDGSGFGLSPLATDRRLVDTRRTGRSQTIVVPTPAGASAVALNLTIDAPAAAGFLSATTCGVASDVSNVNFLQGETVAGAAYVATGGADRICIEVSQSADVIVDLTGTFGAGGLSFVSSRPTRMLDTRHGTGGWLPVHGAAQTIDAVVAPAAAEAVTGTVTLVEPATSGAYLIGHRCGAVPPTSSVNANAGQVMANSLTTGVSGGRLCVWSYGLTHTLFDVTGWWVR